MLIEVFIFFVSLFGRVPTILIHFSSIFEKFMTHKIGSDFGINAIAVSTFRIIYSSLGILTKQIDSWKLNKSEEKKRKLWCIETSVGNFERVHRSILGVCSWLWVSILISWVWCLGSLSLTEIFISGVSYIATSMRGTHLYTITLCIRYSGPKCG